MRAAQDTRWGAALRLPRHHASSDPGLACAWHQPSRTPAFVSTCPTVPKPITLEMEAKRTASPVGFAAIPGTENHGNAACASVATRSARSATAGSTSVAKLVKVLILAARSPATGDWPSRWKARASRASATSSCRRK